MPDQLCAAGCGKPSAEPLCPACWGTLCAALREVIGGQPDAAGNPTPGLAAELDTTLARLDRFGGSGGRVRLSEQPLPVKLHASEAAGRLTAVLGTWVRDLHETHAIRWRECSSCAARWYGGEMRHEREDCAGLWREVVDPLTVADTAVELAAWLLRHPSWVRNHAAVGELHRDISGAVRRARIAVDRPPDRIPLGVCGAETLAEDGTVVRCKAALVALDGQSTVRCRTCGNGHVVEDRRRAELAKSMEQLERSRERLVTTTEAIGLLDRVGIMVTTSVIRGLKKRGRLHPKIKGDGGYLRLRQTYDPAGPDLWRVGDVLDELNRAERRRTQLREAG